MSETDYKFKFYLVNNAMQLVFGFESQSEAEFYCDILGNSYRVISYDWAKKFNIDPKDINNWSENVPEILESLSDNE